MWENIRQENAHFRTTYNFTSSWLPGCSWKIFIHQSKFCVPRNSNQCLSLFHLARRPSFHWRMLGNCSTALGWAILFSISLTVIQFYLIQNKITESNPNGFYTCSFWFLEFVISDAFKFLKQHCLHFPFPFPGLNACIGSYLERLGGKASLNWLYSRYFIISRFAWPARL